VRKLARAHIILQWERDIEAEWVQHERDNQARGPSPESYLVAEELQHLKMQPNALQAEPDVKIERRCETCRHCGSRVYEGGIYEQWCRIHLQRCAPNGFRDWEANDES